MNRPTRIVLLFVIVMTGYTSEAQLKVAKLFSDHMVLQRNKPVTVWGWADTNSTVKIVFNGQNVSAKADKSGAWKATLKPMIEGGPFEMKVQAKKETLTITDVMIGEVWICSGQSNMEWGLASADGGPREVENSARYSIRHFKVPNSVSLSPVSELNGGQWKVASPATAGEFTAVGYFFAKEIAVATNVTIGLLNTSWGGSQAEGWISKEAMLTDSHLKEYAKQIPDNWEAIDKKMEQKLMQFLQRGGSSIPEYSIDKLMTDDPTVFENWPKSYAPGAWDWQPGMWAYRGKGFMMKLVDIPEQMTKQVSTISLGENDGDYVLYVNGKLIKKSNVSTIEVPAGTWKKGKNIFLIELSPQVKQSWFGLGFYGDRNKLFIEGAGFRLPLDGNDWRLMPSLKEPYHFERLQNNEATILYNAMVNPLIPYAVRGVLWYQGEANAGRSYEYATTFPLLINDWRSRWKETLPFYFVQLATFGKKSNSNEGSGWAELREAQLKTLSLPATGMAVTTDIGNPDDVHPRNKLDVGKRLAAIALNNLYSKSQSFEGPKAASYEFKNGKAVIQFQSGGGKLTAKDKYGYLQGFEIAGNDHVFYYAKAEISGNSVVVSSESVKEPVAVRYAWSDSPVDANLFNTEGFPASPFRTDSWPGVTVDAKFH